MIDQIIPYIKPIAIQIAYAIGFLIVGTIITRSIAHNVSKNIIRSNPNTNTKKMAGVVYNMIATGSFIVLLLMSISVAGINISLIIGGIGLAIGYAMEEVLGNIFASLMIVTHRHYHVGDTVKIGGQINQIGTIESISTRITTIRTYDKQRLMIPNLTMIRTPITPFSKKQILKCESTIIIPRHIDIAHIRSMIIQAISKNPATTAQEYTTLLLTDYTQGGARITYYYYFNPANEGGVGRLSYISDINTAIHNTLQQMHIHHPYPTRIHNTYKLNN